MKKLLSFVLIMTVLTTPLAAQNILATHRLTVISDPGQADVFIDGKRVGATPYAARLSPGNYQVRVVRQGYSLWERRISLQEDQRLMATLTLAQPSNQPNNWLWGTLGGIMIAGGAAAVYFLVKRSGRSPLPGTPPSPP